MNKTFLVLYYLSCSLAVALGVFSLFASFVPVLLRVIYFVTLTPIGIGCAYFMRKYGGAA